MAAARYSSRVFIAGKALLEAIDRLGFPNFQGQAPDVRFGDADPDKGSEVVGVVLNLDRQSIEWARVGPAGRDETLVFDVVHRLMSPNIKTTYEVWGRLEEVSELVQSVLFDTNSNQVDLLNFPGEVKMGMVAAVVPQVFPGPDGWNGQCITTFEIRTRI